MKRFTLFFFGLLVASFFNVLSAQPGQIKKGDIVPESYLIIFKESELPSFLTASQGQQFNDRQSRGNAARAYEQQMVVNLQRVAREKLGIVPSMIKDYYTTAFTGILVQLKNDKARGLAAKLQQAQEISNIEADFYLAGDGQLEEAPASAFPAQSIDWGVNFVGSGNYTGNKWIWVIDTGIDLDHPDLNVVGAPFGASFVDYTSSPDDDHNHGTHVAGIAAAKNNGFGTIGVAAGARVVPVKVLDKYGYGKWSWIANGINHVAKYYLPGDVVNLSLGGPKPSLPRWFWPFDDRWNVEDAVRNIAAKGVFVTIAAGNDNTHASNYTPARVNGNCIFTISNMDQYRRIHSTSNYGNGPVDYAAPGASILSTLRGGGYGRMTGTSMAAPHVAGILLINNGYIRTRGRVVYDKDSTYDLIAVK